MKKTMLVWLGFIFLMFHSVLSLAQNFNSADNQISFFNDTITIKNTSGKAINLHNAMLEFYYNGKEILLDQQKIYRDFSQQPNSAGNYYKISLNNLNKLNSPYLLPGKSIIFKLTTDQINIPHGFKLFTVDRVPVQVKVTVASPNWTQTISICNNSSSPIPLTDVEFDFNYDMAMPSSIWGQPWTAWHVGSQQGTQVMLLGGTPWTPALQPDPNCTKPLTIQFGSTPTSPAPTGPFTFKAAGGTPAILGAITITMPAAPLAGAANQQVTVNGAGTNMSQVVPWETKWALTKLTPGSYTITATPFDNGAQFYQATPISVMVNDANPVPVSISYKSVKTSSITVTLVNAPDPQEPVTLTGKNYTLKANVGNNSVLTLPEDTYTVTSVVPGVAAVINPNPLIVPTNTTLTITYQKSASARFVGYFQTWNGESQTSDGSKTNLANLPSYVNVVNLSFMKPDAVYQKGSLSISGTGLEFNFTGPVLKQAVASLHQRNPNTKVLVAVGGASYVNWNNLNAKAIADFVTDLGLDGVDIDYEPTSTGCALGNDGLIHCQIDAEFEGFVESLRSVLPRPSWITVTGFSVGAYGQDQWKNALPPSQYTGMMLPLLRTPAAKDIDMVNVMSYDAGNTFDPIQALAAYSNYYPGPISMGVEVPPEAWGGHVYDMTQVENLTQAVKTSATQHNNTPPGMMMWSIQKVPNGTPSPSNPSAQMMATSICTNLGLLNCNQPLLNH